MGEHAGRLHEATYNIDYFPSERVPCALDEIGAGQARFRSLCHERVSLSLFSLFFFRLLKTAVKQDVCIPQIVTTIIIKIIIIEKEKHKTAEIEK